MTASTDIEQLEHLDFEHDLPCEAELDCEPCTRPAEWIVWFISLFSRTPYPMCTPCRDTYAKHISGCPHCGATFVMQVTKL